MSEIWRELTIIAVIAVGGAIAASFLIVGFQIFRGDFDKLGHRRNRR